MTRDVLTVVGARPQFIKAAPVSSALRDAGLREILVHTGQHYDEAMSDRFFSELGLREPDHHFGIGSGTHAHQTGRMMIAIEQLLLSDRPDWVLVYGDTNSTLAAALAAAKCCVPIAHVEAGLRSGNMMMPEEINRISADRVSSLLFAPTADAVRQLEREGADRHRIVLSGDVMYDAALTFAPLARERSNALERFGLQVDAFILATIHRAENTDDPSRLTAIVSALGAAEMPVCLPLHPRTAKMIREHGVSLGGSIHAIEPVGYLDMQRLLSSTRLVVTDSGGVQKEAYFARKPCVTVRNETEWTELVASGWNRLAPPHDFDSVATAIATALATPAPGTAPAFYGEGNASNIIAAAIASASRP